MAPSSSRGGGGSVEIMDEDSLLDRTQNEQGLFDGKIVLLDFKATVSKNLTFEARQKRWKGKTTEEKNAKFNKIFQPQNTKKWPSTMKSQPVESVVFFKNPVKGRFGMPLKPFPEQKHDHSKIVVRKKANGVDYSIDEHDITWLVEMNQTRNGREFVSVAIYEHWVDRLEKWSTWKPREHHKLRDESGKELEDVCNICLDPDTSNCNQIVYCDRCNLTVHQDCYGIPFIPEGCLECRRCVVSPARRVSCVLCPSRTGAFKQVDHKRWVHVLCVIWVDETHFGNTIFMENVQNVEKALYDRKALSCMLCRVHSPKHAKHGACIQCSEAKCTASFHVTCARNHGFTMRIVENENGTVNRFVWCPKHQPELTDSDKEQHQRMLRNQRRENEKMAPQISSSMPTLTKSTIHRIRLECPFRDFRDIIVFWYQKRQNRLGAPLLKLFNRAAGGALEQAPPTFANVVEMEEDSEEEEEEEDVEKEKEKEEEKPETEPETTREVLLEEMHEFGVDVEKKEENTLQVLLDSISSMKKLCVVTKTIPLLLDETLDKLKAKDGASVFAEPVEIAGYRALIKNPISLKDMTEKLRTKKYKCVSQIAADITLMLQNCAAFNVKNKYFLNYGSNYKRHATRILDEAAREEAEMTSMTSDENLKEQVMTKFMENSRDSGDFGAPGASERTPGPSSGRRGRRRREPATKIEKHEEVLEVEEDVEEEEDVKIKVELEEEDEPEILPPPTRRGRKRQNGETLNNDDSADQKTSGSLTSSGRDSGKDSGASGASGATTTTTSFGGLFKKSTLKPKSPGLLAEPIRKRNHPETSKASSMFPIQKQTKMTSFFSLTPSATTTLTKQPQVTFAEGTEKLSDESLSQQQQQQRPHQNPFTSNFNASKLFPVTSSAFFPPPPTSASTTSSRITRSSAPLTSSTTSSTTNPRRHGFRISSSNIQSPNPEPPRRSGRHLNPDADDDVEIQIQPIQPVELSPEQLRAEKLRSAENEAKSKFAHNQLVIVDGRAAKVIDVQLAHLTDIHREQRQWMMKKRREVLSEIPKSTVIYVEFFQKSSNSLENLQWVDQSKVDLLDLNTVQQKGIKVTGLKAAREWHQKVINGDV